ncbi:probable inactive receptor kinase At1g27190 [Rhodamnia argentea]|uniref:Probable inactive receptor kinase At1g27190 n=1 Tax=Rhodamnia argentea TaxID=178133 RepID=A0A8B8NA91_9MYRT|nr:probable inactive receptor kinase At1g27190 [Rhodamnia argentea]
MSASAAASAILSLHWLLLFAATVEDDVLCLEGVKSSLTDPQGSLSLWTFTNTSASHICNLQGVSCWNLNKNRIISLQLTGLELSGGLPESLKNCHSLQTLDLSQNKLNGPIPTQICQWLPYLVRLDLSSNSLSGSIPSQIADCKFLNYLILSDNKLSGSIPYEVGRLDRLKQFSVKDNHLSGSIPSELSRFGSEDFSGNDGLCGKPLGSCGGLSKKSLAIIIAVGVVGAAGNLLLGFGFWWWYFGGASRKKRVSGSNH